MELELHLLFRSPGGGGGGGGVHVPSGRGGHVPSGRGGGGGHVPSGRGVISILSSCYSISNCDHFDHFTVHFTVCPYCPIYALFNEIILFKFNLLSLIDLL